MGKCWTVHLGGTISEQETLTGEVAQNMVAEGEGLIVVVEDEAVLVSEREGAEWNGGALLVAGFYRNVLGMEALKQCHREDSAQRHFRPRILHQCRCLIRKSHL